MNFINCLLDTVLTWEITEEGFTDADITLACLLAGFNPEELNDIGSD